MRGTALSEQVPPTLADAPVTGPAEQQAMRGQVKAVAATVSNEGRNFSLTSVQELEVMHAHNPDYSAVHLMPQVEIHAWEQWPGSIPVPCHSPSEFLDEDMLHLPPHIPAFCHEACHDALEDISIGGREGIMFAQGFTMTASSSEYEYGQAVYEPALQLPVSPRQCSYGNDNGWRCSVKNSFLHIGHGRFAENSSTTYQANPDNDFENSYDSSSQRSSSVPSRFTHDKDDRDQRHQDLDRETRDSLALMGFDWGLPMPAKRSWLPTSTADLSDGAGLIETIHPLLEVQSSPTILSAFDAPILRVSA